MTTLRQRRAVALHFPKFPPVIIFAWLCGCSVGISVATIVALLTLV